MTDEKHAVMDAIKWGSKEIREYIITGTALVVALQATGTLDRIFPLETDQGTIKPTTAELAPAVERVDDLGRVVLDPSQIEDLVPMDLEVDIGQALVLECPFEGGCALATPEIILQPFSLPITSSEEVIIPVEFIQPDPLAEFGPGILIGFVLVVVLATSIYKRTWRKLIKRIKERKL